MSKCVLITLTLSTSDTDNFDLWADSGGTGTPNMIFETGISRSALISGYTSTMVPDTATIIRAKSNAGCTNYIDEPLCGFGAMAVLSPCPSVTPSITPTISVTPTSTPAVSPSVTPTRTPSVTPTRTPSVTPTPSETLPVIGIPAPFATGMTYSTLNSSHTYPTFIIDFGPSFAGKTSSLTVEPYGETPNNFVVKRYSDTGTALSTGWVGDASYSGPWGPSLSNLPSNPYILTLTERYYMFQVWTVTGPTYTDNWYWTIPAGV